MDRLPVVLSIAGSDPSGGAGIQADIKSISALGGYAAAAITAITVQNTVGVRAVSYLDPALVAAQAEAVLQDLRVDAVKIGMTGSPDIVAAIADVLRKYPVRHVIVDPVMVSTSRHSLAMPESVDYMCKYLFPLSTLVTPNLDETSVLVGEKIDTVDKMTEAAGLLSEKYGCAFLVKGGHLSDLEEGPSCVDVLSSEEGRRELFKGLFVDTENLHGTGCSLSSAIATLMASGRTLSEAVADGKRYVNEAIAASVNLGIGEGNGPLDHFYGFR